MGKTTLFKNFIDEYDEILYTKNNIHKYCELVFKFGIYSIDEKFIDHLVDKYIFSDSQLLDELKNYEQIIENIQKKLALNNKYNDGNILYLLQNIGPLEITILNASNNDNITNKSVKHLINLTSLDASCNHEITDEGIKSLINLTSLNATLNFDITDEGVKFLTNLTSLDAIIAKNITNDGIKHLINLTSLNASYNDNITNDGIKHLVNLKNIRL